MNLKVVNSVMLTLFLASMSLNLAPAVTHASSGETTFSVQPSIIGLTLIPGDSFAVNVYVYEAVDVYAWRVNMKWDPAVLKATKIFFGGFLADKPEGSITFSSIEPGHLFAFESTVGKCAGGKFARFALLCTITFSVKAFGDTVLDISGDETYYVRYADLTLLPEPTPRYPIIENGYFVNRLPWWLMLLISLLRLLGPIP